MSRLTLEEKQERLQAAVGERPIIEIGSFENWAKTQKVARLLKSAPATLKELKRLVSEAKNLGIKMRAMGVAHSWSPLFPDEEELLIQTYDLQRHDGPRIELVKQDGENLVTVLTCVSVKELMDFGLKHKVNLPCDVILTTPTYGGIIGAGCHGTGWDCKAIPDYMVKMRIVNSDGKLKEYTKDSNPELFSAIQTNLGLFGVIYDITLKMSDEKIVRATNEFDRSVNDILYNSEALKSLVENNDTVEIFWWPFNSMGQLTNWKPGRERDAAWDPANDMTWVKLVNIRNNPTGHLTREYYYQQLELQTWKESRMVQLTDDILTSQQFLTPAFLKGSFEHLRNSTKESLLQPLLHAIHYRPNIEMMEVYDMELCFQIPNGDFSIVSDVTRDTTALVQEYASRDPKKYPLNIALEMRFMADSEAMLCPAYTANSANGGSGHCVYIEVLSYTDTENWEEFCDSLFDRWSSHGVKPTIHWAKQWAFSDLQKGVDRMREAFGDQIPTFNELLRESEADPEHIFMNEALREIFLTPSESRKGSGKKMRPQRKL